MRLSLQREVQRLERSRDQLTAELADIVADIEKRIHGLNTAIQALAVVSEGATDLEVPLTAVQQDRFDITSNIREVLQNAAAWLMVPEIRDALVAKGWKADDYDNPLAVIHTILKRLVKSGEVSEQRVQGGKKAFCHEPSIMARQEERARRDVERARAAHAQH